MTCMAVVPYRPIDCATAGEACLLTTGPAVTTMLARKKSIEELLRGAAATVLERADGINDWVIINAALATVHDQHEQKPKGGRPRGGVAEAARKLPLPRYMSESARCQLVQRCLRIGRIFPRAKDEARLQKLDDNQTALLAIAAEETEEAQVAKARAWRFRNASSSSPPQPESYTITGLENLPAKQRQKLKRVMKLVASRFHASVLHANPSFIDE
jgi:hypothetical protein